MSAIDTKTNVQRCIQRCAGIDATGQVRGQATRRCAEQLARQGSTPAVAAATAAAARRLGEWLGAQRLPAVPGAELSASHALSFARRQLVTQAGCP